MSGQETMIFISRPLFECYIPMQHKQGSALTDLKNFSRRRCMKTFEAHQGAFKQSSSFCTTNSAVHFSDTSSLFNCYFRLHFRIGLHETTFFSAYTQCYNYCVYSTLVTYRTLWSHKLFCMANIALFLL